MQKILNFLLILVVTLSFGQIAKSQSIQRLDEIMDKSSTLENFLADPYLLDEYYLSLEAYFKNPEFNRTLFDKIIVQMQSLSKVSSKFSKQAWRKDNLAPDFGFKGSYIDWGRDLNSEMWTEYFINYLNTAQLNIERNLGQPMSKDQVTNLALHLEGELKNFEREAQSASLGKKIEAQRRAEFFKNFLGRPQTQAVLEYMALEKLKSLKADLASKDATTILQRFKFLRENGEPWELNSEKFPALTGLAKSKILKVETLLQREDIFPKRVIATRNGVVEQGKSQEKSYFFRSVRPFHSFFTGIPHNECVGGACSKRHKATPERWASAVLKNSDVYFLESGDKYNGNIRMNLVNGPHGLFQSVDMMASDLNKVLVVENAHGEIRSAHVMEFWLEHVAKLHLHGSKGILVGESDAFSNEGNPTILKKTNAYLTSALVGDYKQFSHSDSLAHEIVQWSRQNGLPYDYGNHMITEVTVDKAGAIHLLKLENATTNQCSSIFL